MSMKEKSSCSLNRGGRRVYDWHRQDTRMTELGDICVTASASWGNGGNNMPYVLDVMCVGNGQLAQAKISDKVGALNCMHDQQCLLEQKINVCKGGDEMNGVSYIVRRLTPL